MGGWRADPSSGVDHAERRKQVQLALEALSPPQRRAIELAFFEGLSQSEIAERLQEPLGTIKTRVRLGMQKLRESPATVLLRARPMSHPEQDSLQDLAAAYALGALLARGGAAVRGVPRRLAGGAARGGGVPRGGGAAGARRPGAGAVARPAGADAGADRTRPAGRPAAPPRRSRCPWGALAAGLVAVVGLGFGYAQRREVRELRAELGRTVQRLAQTVGVA